MDTESESAPMDCENMLYETDGSAWKTNLSVEAFRLLKYLLSYKLQWNIFPFFYSWWILKKSSIMEEW